MSDSTKLIRLEDGSLVEVAASTDESEQIAGSSGAARVEASLDAVIPLLKKACKPLAAAWKELDNDVNIEQAEIELGLSFEAEGNLYITKATTGANLKVKLIMQQKSQVS